MVDKVKNTIMDDTSAVHTLYNIAFLNFYVDPMISFTLARFFAMVESPKLSLCAALQ